MDGIISEITDTSAIPKTPVVTAATMLGVAGGITYVAIKKMKFIEGSIVIGLAAFGGMALGFLMTSLIDAKNKAQAAPTPADNQKIAAPTPAAGKLARIPAGQPLNATQVIALTETRLTH